jgi:hypothetical protein
MYVRTYVCMHACICSSPTIFLNLARRFAVKAVRLALPSTFYYGLGNVLRVCLLDLAAVVHEILHLRLGCDDLERH